MINIINILKGWENFLDKSEVSENVAKSRAEICSTCPFAKHSKLIAFIKDDLKEIEGFKCTKCSCPLSAKLRSLNETCPDGRW